MVGTGQGAAPFASGGAKRRCHEAARRRETLMVMRPVSPVVRRTAPVLEPRSRTPGLLVAVLWRKPGRIGPHDPLPYWTDLYPVSLARHSDFESPGP